MKRQRATAAPAAGPPVGPPVGPQRRWPGKQHKRRRRRTTTTTTTTTEPDVDDDEMEPTTTLATTTVDPRSFDHSKCLSAAEKTKYAALEATPLTTTMTDPALSYKSKQNSKFSYLQ